MSSHIKGTSESVAPNINLECEEQKLRQVIINDPEDAVAHNSLGNLLQRMGKIKEAKIEFELALKYETNNKNMCNICINLGSLYVIDENLERGAEYFKLAVKHNPNNAMANCNIGAMLIQEDKYDEAELYIDKAISQLDVLVISSNMNIHQQKLSLTNEAMPYYYKALILCNGAQKYNEARDFANKALHLNPDFPSFIEIAESIDKIINEVDEKDSKDGARNEKDDKTYNNDDYSCCLM